VRARFFANEIVAHFRFSRVVSGQDRRALGAVVYVCCDRCCVQALLRKCLARSGMRALFSHRSAHARRKTCAVHSGVAGHRRSNRRLRSLAYYQSRRQGEEASPQRSAAQDPRPAVLQPGSSWLRPFLNTLRGVGPDRGRRLIWEVIEMAGAHGRQHRMCACGGSIKCLVT